MLRSMFLGPTEAIHVPNPWIRRPIIRHYGDYHSVHAPLFRPQMGTYLMLLPFCLHILDTGRECWHCSVLVYSKIK
jgi:hypothetical protein